MNSLDILLANDRIAWLDREAIAIQRRSRAVSGVAKNAVADDMNRDPRRPYTHGTAAARRIEPVGRP